jgi:hypothetical protein
VTTEPKNTGLSLIKSGGGPRLPGTLINERPEVSEQHNLQRLAGRLSPFAPANLIITRSAGWLSNH